MGKTEMKNEQDHSKLIEMANIYEREGSTYTANLLREEARRLLDEANSKNIFTR